MAGGAMPSGALPAATGAPHLYHLGADSFFLDQANTVGLTSEQQRALTALKENAAMAYATTQRRIEQGEQDLWVLSSSDNPDITKIEAKIGEVARRTGQQRLDFIRAIGKAVSVLSDGQRKAIAAQAGAMQLGTMPPAAGAPSMNMGSPPAPTMPMGRMPAGAMPPPGMGPPGGMPLPGMGPPGGMPPPGMGMGSKPDAGPPSGMGHM